MKRSTRFTTVRGGKVLHTNPEGNRHTVCGIVAENTVYVPNAMRGLSDGTLRFCGNCARVKPVRDLDPAPRDEPTDTWTVTNEAGDEVTRFTAALTADADEYIRMDADCRDWARLEGGNYRRRLRRSEL